jgi:hypothetical protein
MLWPSSTSETVPYFVFMITINGQRLLGAIRPEVMGADDDHSLGS